jgi:hypothetical protein
MERWKRGDVAVATRDVAVAPYPALPGAVGRSGRTGRDAAVALRGRSGRAKSPESRARAEFQRCP